MRKAKFGIVGTGSKQLTRITRAEVRNSFWRNDADECRFYAAALSRKYLIWYAVTWDGTAWHSYAHLPMAQDWLQAVEFNEGKITAFWQLGSKEQVE